jgi:hypothetical protein
VDRDPEGLEDELLDRLEAQGHKGETIIAFALGLPEAEKPLT